MEILQQPREGRLEMELRGRFDANWAEHVGAAIDAAIRSGHHHVDLNLAGVDYLSSAGIRVLLKYFKLLSAARGSLRVVQTTEAVLSVLQLSGIATMLVEVRASSPKGGPAAQPAGATGEPLSWESNGVRFESFEQVPGGVLEGRLVGNPDDFGTGRLDSVRSTKVQFDATTIGLGVGAFGGGPADARGRFGECLAAAGTAVVQPTDGSSVPDFVVAEGRLLPEVNLLYGLTAAGRFRQLLRFEAGSSPHRVIGLSQLVEAALQGVKSDAAGFVVLAESASVVGAALRQSPAVANGQSPWTFPAIRDWLSFTTERSEERNAVLIAGFADRNPTREAAPFLRRIGPGTAAQGHFHAAVFPYRPVPKGNLDLRESVAGLLSTESAQAVLHLLADEREFEGVGQTDLMRGACWVGPLNSLKGGTST